MYRRGFGKSRPAVTTSFEKQVMAKDRAMATYGLTYEELVRVPCTYRSCHGNSYAVWNNGELTKARTEKRARVQAEAQAKEQAKEQALIDEHGVEGLKRIRAEEAAAREAELAKDSAMAMLFAASKASCVECAASSSAFFVLYLSCSAASSRACTVFAATWWDKMLFDRPVPSRLFMSSIWFVMESSLVVFVV